MTDDWCANLLHRLRAAAEADPELRSALRASGKALVAELDAIDPRAAAARAAIAPPPLPAAVAPSPEPKPAPPAPRVPAPLRIGDEVRVVQVRAAPEDSRAADTVPPGYRGPVTVTPAPSAPAAGAPASGAAAQGAFDPPLVGRRCAIKAEAARWAIDRRRRVAAGDRDVHERDRELFTKAKALPNCYLWMMDPKGPPLPDDGVLALAADCYETLARAVAAVAPLAGPDPNGNGHGSANGSEKNGAGGDAPSSIAASQELLQDALYLLAEAQSGLRAVLQEVYPTLQDWDQREVFFWLRRQTAERGIYVSRYMRMDDIASPEDGPDLRRRIEDLKARCESRHQQKKARQSLIGKAKYHARHVTDAGGDASPDEWQKLTSALEDLVKAGVPPSDVEIREVVLPLVPLLDDMPDEDAIGLGPGMRAILTETDRYLSAGGREAADAQARERERGSSPEVRRVAEMLRGKTVVLIGGEARPHAKRALEQTFELDELDWVSTQSHQSVSAFEPAVARPETAVVLLAIRWSSHSFGEVKSMCDRYGKPFVRLPGGYNPDQVARQILEQVSGRLEAGAPSST